jgi:drug/metabolite transporter superfamily protein YnfA
VALILLLVQVLRDPAHAFKTSLILFVLAALGGFYMFFQDLRGKFSPTWLAFVHGLLALAGFALLLVAVF